MSARGDRFLAAFEAARAESDPAARERILQQLCGDDAAMLADLRRMLAVEVPDDFLADREDSTPRMLGEFVLVRVLDEGGSGVVWIAEQPSLQRRVAIKVMTAGPGTQKTQIERFHRKGQHSIVLRMKRNWPARRRVAALRHQTCPGARHQHSTPFWA